MIQSAFNNLLTSILGGGIIATNIEPFKTVLTRKREKNIENFISTANTGDNKDTGDIQKLSEEKYDTSDDHSTVETKNNSDIAYDSLAKATIAKQGLKNSVSERREFIDKIRENLPEDKKPGASNNVERGWNLDVKEKNWT